MKTWSAKALLKECADARSGVGQEQWHNFWRTTLKIGDRIARPATIHWHTNVWSGGNMAKTQPDRIAIKRKLSLLGSVDWWLTNFMTNIIFQALFYLFSLCWRGGRLTKIPRPEYDVAYAGKWCLSIGRLSLGPSPCQDSGTNMPTLHLRTHRESLKRTADRHKQAVSKGRGRRWGFLLLFYIQYWTLSFFLHVLCTRRRIFKAPTTWPLWLLLSIENSIS